MGVQENERRSPISYYFMPSRTIERPIRHWYTYHTDTEDSDDKLNDAIAEESDYDDGQLDLAITFQTG